MPIAGVPRLQLAGHIDNVLSIGARKPLVVAASVLHRALTRPLQVRGRDALRSPAEHAATVRMIAAGPP